VKRRTFIAGISSTAAWPVVALAQQRGLPVIGFLSAQSADDEVNKIITVPLHQGLKETGYVEGQNVAVAQQPPCPRPLWPPGALIRY